MPAWGKARRPASCGAHPAHILDDRHDRDRSLFRPRRRGTDSYVAANRTADMSRSQSMWNIVRIVQAICLVSTGESIVSSPNAWKCWSTWQDEPEKGAVPLSGAWTLEKGTAPVRLRRSAASS